MAEERAARWRKWSRRARAAWVILCVGACGGVTSGAGNDAGGNSSRNPACPSTLPTSGDRCTAVAGCEYAGGHRGCSTYAACALDSSVGALRWSVQPPAADCGATGTRCPSTFTSFGAGASCEAPGWTCDYPEGRCGCVPCAPGSSSGEWSCRSWESGGGNGCPASAPLLGDGCSTPDLVCAYAGCISQGSNMRCSDGYWQGPLPAACPFPACVTGGDVGAPCSINSDCAQPLLCAFQRCHTACETSRDCPVGERCVMNPGSVPVCLAPTETTCTMNSECPGTQICAPSGQCREVDGGP